MEYEVTAPDGRRFVVTAPEGATQEQVLAYARQNFQPQTPQAPDTSLAQNVGVVTRGAAPPVAAAAGGALLGSRFGAPGSRAGAALGPLLLGAADIGATGYNIAAPYVGLPNVGVPSQVIQDVLERFGVGRQPETYGQQVLSDVATGGTTAGVQAAAFNVLARRLGESMARNLMPQARVQSQQPPSVMSRLAEQPAAQVGAGAGGAAAPTLARGLTEDENLYQDLAASLAGAVFGGIAASKAATGARGVVDTARRRNTPTTAELKTQANRLYAAADNAGAQYDPAAAASFADDLRNFVESQGYTVGTNTPTDVNKTIGILSNSSQPVSFTQLHQLRKDLAATRRSLASSPDPAADTQARLVGAVIRRLDDFTLNPPQGALAAGDVAATRKAVTDARAAWARASKSEDIEEAVYRASLSEKGTSGRMDEALRTEFSNLAKRIREGKASNFTDDEIANIERIGRGEARGAVVKALSAISPGLTSRGAVGFIAPAAATGATLYSGAHPELMAAAMGLAGVAGGARAARNMMAEQAAANLAAGARRGDVQAPIAARPVPMISPTLQQMLYQPEYEAPNAFAR
jgi:hypothetical protein